METNKAVCPYCKKEFATFNEEHKMYTLRQHVLSKHPEKIDWPEEMV
jgi:glutaredoxin